MRGDISDFWMQNDDIISMKPSNSAGEHSSNTNTHFLFFFLLGGVGGGGHRRSVKWEAHMSYCSIVW